MNSALAYCQHMMVAYYCRDLAATSLPHNLYMDFVRMAGEEVVSHRGRQWSERKVKGHSDLSCCMA